ncbi:MAG: bifunctional riboflavin kinase/FAD synthetase [Actinomycetota bacterium]|nr:bifunctional riboflavin kinase/FAD synthetase [Actinomycetota bacterium]
MTVWRDLRAVQVDGPTVVTIGNFDGVHLGHRTVLNQARRAAWDLGGRSDGRAPVVTVTFDPHPMAVLAPDQAPPQLTTLERRLELLAGAGADHVLVLGFDRSVAAWSPGEFVRRVLLGALHAGAVVVGANFRYGARAAGTVDTLRTDGSALGFGVQPVELGVGAGQAPWSSTAARNAVTRGDMGAAAGVLGRDHAVDGVVVEGDHRGRALGYPTANVPAPSTVVVPADGVYAGTLRRLDRPDAPELPAAISVGTNPTFAGVARRIEAYVLDRDDLELYGVPVRIAFTAHLRGQERFDNVDALVAQMATDVEQTRRAVPL